MGTSLEPDRVCKKKKERSGSFIKERQLIGLEKGETEVRRWRKSGHVSVSI